MDIHQIRKISLRLRRAVGVQNKILQYGNIVGNILESLPLPMRALIIKEIQRVQEVYRIGIGQLSNLSLQLMRIEHYRMNPGFYEDPDNRRDYVPKTYGDAMVAYISSIPITKREQALNHICNIALHVAGDEFLNLLTKQSKVC